MKHCPKLLLLILFPCLMNAQQGYLDSLKNVFRNTSDGPLRFKAPRDIYNYYEDHSLTPNQQDKEHDWAYH